LLHEGQGEMAGIWRAASA